jgi:acid stress-induced BolA-like protein IbaG/YrbA
MVLYVNLSPFLRDSHLIHPKDIKQFIENGIDNSAAIVDGDDGRHFTAIVVSSTFANKTRIQRQQAVYRTLDRIIQDGTLHAISIKTFTPDEWQQQKTTAGHG